MNQINPNRIEEAQANDWSLGKIIIEAIKSLLTLELPFAYLFGMTKEIFWGRGPQRTGEVVVYTLFGRFVGVLGESRHRGRLIHTSGKVFDNLTPDELAQLPKESFVNKFLKLYRYSSWMPGVRSKEVVSYQEIPPSTQEGEKPRLIEKKLDPGILREEITNVGILYNELELFEKGAKFNVMILTDIESTDYRIQSGTPGGFYQVLHTSYEPALRDFGNDQTAEMLLSTDSVKIAPIFDILNYTFQSYSDDERKKMIEDQSYKKLAQGFDAEFGFKTHNTAIVYMNPSDEATRDLLREILLITILKKKLLQAETEKEIAIKHGEGEAEVAKLLIAEFTDKNGKVDDKALFNYMLPQSQLRAIGVQSLVNT